MSLQFPRSVALPLRAVVLLVGVAALLVPAACGGVQRQPTSYGDAYEANFMFGCTGKEADGKVPYGGEVLAPKDQCQCIYDSLVKRVPFKEAKAFEEQQADAANGSDIKIPPDIAKIIDECSRKS